MCYHPKVEVRRQPTGVSSRLQPCGSQESKSGHHAGWQGPFPTEPSHQLSTMLVYKKKTYTVQVFDSAPVPEVSVLSKGH